MPSPTLFIGLVSHERTGYVDSLGPEGLGQRLQRGLGDARLVVNTRNLADEQGINLSRRSVQSSLSAEIRADGQWGRFLGRDTDVRWWINHMLRRIRRLGRLFVSPPVATVRRLLNIELSHMDLMRQGLDSGAPWLLILEDDAGCHDVNGLSEGLKHLIHSAHGDGLVNLSESFTFDELGLTRLLTADNRMQWSEDSSRTVLRCELAATNTVCAILYSRGAAQRILMELERIPLEPVLPIDWKLNVAVMRLHQSTGGSGISSWFVHPAPIQQRSMKAPGILPT